MSPSVRLAVIAATMGVAVVGLVTLVYRFSSSFSSSSSSFSSSTTSSSNIVKVLILLSLVDDNLTIG